MPSTPDPMGTFATTGHVCMAGAVRVAPLSVLMPFAYAQIVFATAIGWLLFVIVIIGTVLLFRTSARWVYYGGGED